MCEIQERNRNWVRLVCRFFSAIFLGVGWSAFVWGTFCFYGGPDGRGESAAAFGFWLLFWLIAAIFGGIFYLLWGRSRRALLVWSGSYLLTLAGLWCGFGAMLFLGGGVTAGGARF